jgi:hypothetical protein
MKLRLGTNKQFTKIIQSIDAVNYLGHKVFSQKKLNDYIDSFPISTKSWSNGTYIM